jgi:ABC-type uncharacterized transport system substrate-binding protein
VEENVAKALGEIEASATENKKDLKNLLLSSVKEVEVFIDNLLTKKNVIVITIPYVCHKIFARVVRYATIELEKKFK